ncbi:MAG: hypothetical protein ACR2OV_07195, partial [Hyphomicrobiaceae bacterium]
MDLGEWIKTNATLLIVGIAVLLGGWYLGSQGISGIDELEKKTSARLQSIDTKLKSFDATGNEVTSVAAKLAALEKTSAPMSEKIGALSSELQTVTKSVGTVTESIGTVSENVGAVKSTTGEQIAAANKRIAALEAKLAEIVAQQIKLAKATEKPVETAPAAKAKAQDGVSLGIAESGWLIDDKLYVTLSYVYPGGERVRVGMDGRLYELTKGAAEDFNFEGKRCRLEFTGLEGDKA